MTSYSQLQYLADKYAPGTPEIAETLAKLQLPPHSSVNDDSAVPLPRRNSAPSPHQLALVIRDGRRVATKLASVGEASKTTESTRYTFSQTSPAQSSMSTALEQDFTVEGKKGSLECPFSKIVEPTLEPTPATYGVQEQDSHQAKQRDHSSHHPSDPICAAMTEKTGSQSGAANEAGDSKCPIRYMDQHSPEEIAHYVETHKHELPRSHEVCLRRYQHNEEQIRKLDSKYGNIVSMVEGLGQLHQPMLPGSEQDRNRRQSEVERASNERVQDWAKAVSVTADAVTDDEASQDVAVEEDRRSHFDRPLRDVRVGESPSRPWGIHVPALEPSGYEHQQPFSPPPAPVRMPSPSHSVKATPVKAPGGGKCPFDHTKLAAMAGGGPPPPPHSLPKSSGTPPPLDHVPFTPIKNETPRRPSPSPFSHAGEKDAHHQPPPPLAQPSFINPGPTHHVPGGHAPPQMVFTGPVFIGYPIDQALQIMNQYRPN